MAAGRLPRHLVLLGTCLSTQHRKFILNTGEGRPDSSSSEHLGLACSQAWPPAPSLSQLASGHWLMTLCPLGTLTVEQIYQDRDQFAKLVREVAAPDVGRMGIEILSFTIKVRYSRKCGTPVSIWEMRPRRKDILCTYDFSVGQPYPFLP